MAPLLEVRGVSKTYPGVQALAATDLTMEPGEIHALVGENGAGKSTLIKVLSGAIDPDSGHVLVDGEEASIRSPKDAEALGIATVYQEFNLFPALTVTENILFGRLPRKRGVIDWKRARAVAQAALDDLGTDIRASRNVGELSVAEQQMVEIAKALIRKVRILILDEPTAVLGGADVDELFRIIANLRRQGVGVIFVSHRLGEVFGLADRYTVLKDGQLAGNGDVADVDHDSLVTLMVGRKFGHVFEPPTRSDDSSELLRVENLTRRGAFHDVSFSVHAGEIVGLAGLRGAGRTEIARTIMGADPVDSGQVFVQGKPVAFRSPVDAVGNGIGLVPEERKSQGILLNLSAAPNVSLSRHTRRRAILASPRKERQTAARYIDQLRIRVPNVDEPVGQLSGGNQQKLVLSKWLEAGVSVLILDEPTRGIDIGAKAEVYNTIRDLCEQGLGIVLISSELPEVLALSHRVLVMCQGALAADLPRDAATEERVMTYAVGGQHV